MEEKELNPQQENKMGIMPVNRLLVSMSVPIMLSMLVQALYNIVDSVYVSHISENALNAVSLAFPGAEPDDCGGNRYRRGHQRPPQQKPW